MTLSRTVLTPLAGGCWPLVEASAPCLVDTPRDCVSVLTISWLVSPKATTREKAKEKPQCSETPCHHSRNALWDSQATPPGVGGGWKPGEGRHWDREKPGAPTLERESQEKARLQWVIRWPTFPSACRLVRGFHYQPTEASPTRTPLSHLHIHQPNPPLSPGAQRHNPLIDS